MDTRIKLEEAKYFLEALLRTENNPKEFFYNLSAFLSAWKSVLDVMLYDLAEHYRIGLTREDKMTPHDFWIVVKARNNVQALRFIKWWEQKVGVLSENPLWNMRNLLIHRGYPPIPYRVYTPASMASGLSDFMSSGALDITIPLSTLRLLEPALGPLEIEFPKILEMCKQAFDQMESIVSEAENEFGVLFN